MLARQSSAGAGARMAVVAASESVWELAANATTAAAAADARFCDAATCSLHCRPADPFGYFLGFMICLARGFAFAGALLHPLGIFLDSHFGFGSMTN